MTEFGAASDILAPSKEDERSSALALRARQGDYDDGEFVVNIENAVLINARSHP